MDRSTPADPTAPLVDVGIPAAGRATYVTEAIESVVGQTLRAWRLVVCEDGPGDGAVAAAVVPFLSDPRITFAANGARLGAARNMTGLLARGNAPFVALLHDDDRWAPDFLRRRVEFLQSRPECGFVFSGNVEMDADSREVGRSKLLFAEGVQPIEEFLPSILHRNPVCPVTLLVRRSAYEAVGAAFDERFPNLYDYEMLLRLALEFPAGYLAARDAAYRLHGGQVRLRRDAAEEFLCLYEHAAELVPSELDTRPAMRRRRQRSGALLSCALDALERGEPRRARTKLLQGLSAYPRSIADPRVLATAVGLLAGSRGRRALARARRFVLRKQIRLHLDPG